VTDNTMNHGDCEVGKQGLYGNAQEVSSQGRSLVADQPTGPRG